MNNLFWKTCSVWVLLLGSIFVVRPFLPYKAVREFPAPLPALGEQVEVPQTLLTISGEEIPALSEKGGTFFLVTSSGCPACKRELSTYGELLRMVEGHGLTARMLVLPGGSPEDTEWFFDRLPVGAKVVFDTLGFSLSGLQVGLTPSVVVLGPDGRVTGAFAPPRDWPVTQEMLPSGLR